MNPKKVVDALDHPLMFIVFVGMALIGLSNIVVWGAKRAGLVGLASALGR